MKKVAIFISGRGSNMQSLINASKLTNIFQVDLVVSDNPNAGGLDIAMDLGIPTLIIDRSEVNRDTFEEIVQARLIGIDYICLAGFMRILSSNFVSKWPNKILNIHPSLLPDFPGLNTYARAIESGNKISGCTVHIVIPKMDSGPILLQATVPILYNDTPETLAERILIQEHKCYPAALIAYIDS